MSDNRQQAERQVGNVKSQENLEDSLGSALESSFNIPPPPPKTESSPTEVKEETPVAPSQPVPGLDEWPETLQGYLKEWQAESAVAREKSEITRKRIEDERAAELKAKQDALNAEKKKKQDEEKKKKDEERLRQELEAEEDEVHGAKGHGNSSKVREAWELVAKKEGSTSTAGTSSKKEQVQAPLYDHATSNDPIPPVFQDPKPATSVPAPAESTTLSRNSATSQAWDEISHQSSGSGEKISASQSQSNDSEELVKVPSPEKAPQAPQAPLPPSQPPSLTLTLFTNAKSMSISRVFAVVGINLVLPFINGVMLGFGEIFAREVVRVGRAVWKGERQLFNFGRSAGGLGGRGTTGLGLSGGGF